jgi:hypothetical protein
MWSLFRRKSPFAVFFLPPAAFSLPRKEKGAEYCHFCQDRKEWIAGGIPIDFSIVTCYTSIVNHKR